MPPPSSSSLQFFKQHHQHQHHQIISRIQQWVNSLICKASQTRYIALEQSKNTDVTLCSDILSLLDEYDLSKRNSSTTQNVDDAEERIEERARISVQERTMSMITKWIRQQHQHQHSFVTNASASNNNGLNVTLHCALNILSQIKQNNNNNNNNNTSISLEQLMMTSDNTSSFLDEHVFISSSSNVEEQNIRVSHKTIQESCCQEEGISSPTENLLRKFLSRLCHHYHDGELDEYFRQKSNSNSDAFFISISNHASLLAVEAFAKILSSSSSAAEETRMSHQHICLSSSTSASSSSSLSFLDYFFQSMKLGKYFKRCSLCDMKLTTNFKERILKISKSTSRPSRFMSIPFPASPFCEPRVLSGFVQYVLTPEQILASSNNNNNSKEASAITSTRTKHWETNFDTSSEAWRLNHNFASEVGIVSTNFMKEFGKYVDDSSSAKNKDSSSIRICLLSRIIFDGESQCDDWKKQFLNQFIFKKSGIDESSSTIITLCFINSSSFELQIEALAELMISFQQQQQQQSSSLIFIRVPSSRFEKIALDLDIIPDVVDLVKMGRNDVNNNNEPIIDFHHEKKGANLNLFFCGTQPESLMMMNTTKNHNHQKGCLLQILLFDADHDQDTECSTSKNSFDEFSPSRTTVILYRRVISQMAALQNHFRRVWSHLWSCLFSKNFNNTTSSSKLPSLVKGGGLLDCVWLSRIHLYHQRQPSNNNNSIVINLDFLDHAIRSYLIALNRDASSSGVSTEEAINNTVSKLLLMMTSFGGEEKKKDETLKMNLINGPLIDDHDDVQNSSLPSSSKMSSAFPIDVLCVREENLRSAIEFAIFLSSITSVERSWDVDFDVDDFGKMIVRRVLEFQ